MFERCAKMSLSNSCDKFNCKSKFPISILRSSYVVMSPLLTGSLFPHFFQCSRSVLLRAGSCVLIRKMSPVSTMIRVVNS